MSIFRFFSAATVTAMIHPIITAPIIPSMIHNHRKSGSSFSASGSYLTHELTFVVT